MKELLPEAAEKTSRRGFTKTIASALVAVPVVASLSSCAQKPKVDEPGPKPTPSPQPTPPSPSERDRSNPPVIIDGGSLTLILPGTLSNRMDDDPDVAPKQFNHKYVQRNVGAFGELKGIRIMDDFAVDLLPEYKLVAGETLQVQIWIAKVKSTTGSDDADTDGADYDPNSADPNIAIQGGRVVLRIDERISKDRKLFKRKGKNQKKYHINDWGGSTKFRLAKVKVLVNGTTKYDSAASANIEDHGFRIYLFF